MSGPSALLEQLLSGVSLGEQEARGLMLALAEGGMEPALAGALLAALRAKGETAEEIRGFATAMRELALAPSIPDGTPTVDTVGTGGDGSGSLNLSTGTGLLAAACGVRVVKHGNRSVSSKSGSADLLERLGMPLPLAEPAAIACLEATGFTFLFAPAYHPAMKAIMPVRGALGVRTVFNVLGPLTNPAAPPYQLIGAFSPEVARLMADSLSGLRLERALVVHGALRRAPRPRERGASDARGLRSRTLRARGPRRRRRGAQRRRARARVRGRRPRRAPRRAADGNLARARGHGRGRRPACRRRTRRRRDRRRPRAGAPFRAARALRGLSRWATS